MTDAPFSLEGCRAVTNSHLRFMWVMKRLVLNFLVLRVNTTYVCRADPASLFTIFC